MFTVRLKLSYYYNYIKLVNGKAKIKLLLQLHSNIELMTELDLRLDMCFPYTINFWLYFDNFFFFFCFLVKLTLLLRYACKYIHEMKIDIFV